MSFIDWIFGKSKPEEKESKPKKPKEKKIHNSDKWMYDFLVQFLSSPIWRVSILDFVDNNCIVFDSEDENKFEYTKIHNQFKEMVANLFDGMMQEIGLDEEKLVELLELGFTTKDKKLFNQLLLCDDFMRFKDLMVKRNKALEAEAMRALSGGNEEELDSPLKKERNVLMQSQRDEQERNQKVAKQEEEMLRKALEMSMLDAQEKEAIQHLEQKAQHSPVQEAKDPIPPVNDKSELNKRASKRLNPIQGKGDAAKQLPPIKHAKKVDEGFDEDSQAKLKQKQREKEEQEEREREREREQEEQRLQEEKRKAEQAKAQEESAEDRKKRLMQQREKLRKKKQEERKRMMEDEEKTKQPTIQNIVLQDDGIHDTNLGQPKEEVKKIDTEEVQRRKELMRKIKNRIVDDF